MKSAFYQPRVLWQLLAPHCSLRGASSLAAFTCTRTSEFCSRKFLATTYHIFIFELDHSKRGWQLGWQGSSYSHPSRAAPGSTLFFSLSSDTLSHAHTCRHTARQSSAYPGMRSWAIRSQGEAACSFWVLTHRHAHTHTNTQRKKKWERALTSVTGPISWKSTYAMLEHNSHMLFLWCKTVRYSSATPVFHNYKPNAYSRLQWT